MFDKARLKHAFNVAADSAKKELLGKTKAAGLAIMFCCVAASAFGIPYASPLLIALSAATGAFGVQPVVDGVKAYRQGAPSPTAP